MHQVKHQRQETPSQYIPSATRRNMLILMLCSCKTIIHCSPEKKLYPSPQNVYRVSTYSHQPPPRTKMAYTSTIVCQNPLRLIHSNHVTRINRGSPTLRWQGLKPRAMQITNKTFQPKNLSKHALKKQKYFSLIPTFATELDYIPENPSPSDVIRKLYICINEKNLKGLEDIIANDCLLEDSTFPRSFQGKKKVMKYISQLVESMGENVRFRIGTVCEGGELTASLDWHLEWKDNQIPFSRGCSIFQCMVEDDKLVIRKAQIITESPLKPGELGMGLLKIIASLFDEFPKAAKWFLKSPQTIFKVVFNIYSLFFAPIMNPVIAFYVTLWRLVARLLGYVISTLHFIANFLSRLSPNGDAPRN